MAVDLATVQFHAAQILIGTNVAAIDLAAIQFHVAHVLIRTATMAVDFAGVGFDPAKILIRSARLVTVNFSHRYPPQVEDDSTTSYLTVLRTVSCSLVE
jgi:hypothetical protein